MTASGFLTVAPRTDREESMAPEIAKAVEALEEYEVAYETTPMGTLLEADGPDELFLAAAAAHAAVDADRVVTSLKIDDKRTTDEPMDRKVARVERALGRAPRSPE